MANTALEVLVIMVSLLVAITIISSLVAPLNYFVFDTVGNASIDALNSSDTPITVNPREDVTYSDTTSWLSALGIVFPIIAISYLLIRATQKPKKKKKRYYYE